MEVLDVPLFNAVNAPRDSFPLEGYLKGWNGSWHFHFKNRPTDAIVELAEERSDSEPPQKRTKFTDEASAAAFHVHSDVLKRSEYFAKAMQSSEEGFQALEKRQDKLVLKLVKDPEVSITTYLDCFMLLYHEHICASDFGSVPRALELLKVGLQIMFTAGIDRCYDFLSGMDWTPQEGQEIQELFLSREVPPRDDLVVKMIVVTGDREGIKAMLDVATSAVTSGAFLWKYNEDICLWWEQLTNVSNTVLEAPTYSRLTSLQGKDFLSSRPSFREVIFKKWCQDCEAVITADHRNLNALERWMEFLDALLDANIADAAIEMLCRNERLVEAVGDFLKYMPSIMPRSKLIALIHRIFHMVAQGRVVFGTAVGDTFSIPSSLLLDLCKTWNWALELEQSKLPTFTAAFSKLPLLEQSSFLATRYSARDHGHERCFYEWLRNVQELQNGLL